MKRWVGNHEASTQPRAAGSLPRPPQARGCDRPPGSQGSRSDFFIFIFSENRCCSFAKLEDGGQPWGVGGGHGPSRPPAGLAAAGGDGSSQPPRAARFAASRTQRPSAQCFGWWRGERTHSGAPSAPSLAPLRLRQLEATARKWRGRVSRHGSAFATSAGPARLPRFHGEVDNQPPLLSLRPSAFCCAALRCGMARHFPACNESPIFCRTHVIHGT